MATGKRKRGRPRGAKNRIRTIDDLDQDERIEEVEEKFLDDLDDMSASARDEWEAEQVMKDLGIDPRRIG